MANDPGEYSVDVPKPVVNDELPDLEPRDPGWWSVDDDGITYYHLGDGEDPGQPSADEIQASVEAAGMKFFFVPFNPMNPDPHMVPKFAEAIEQANDGKILAYCRSGNRSSRLWAAVSQ